MKKILLLIALTSASALAAEQTSLKGKALDPDGKAVPRVLIKLITQNGDMARNTETDDMGAYLLEGLAPGAYLVVTEKASFRSTALSIHLSAGDILTHDIKLEIAGINQTIAVTAEGITQTLDEVSKPLSVISSEEITNRNDHALAGLLTTVPGLSVRNQGGPGQYTTVSARGLRSDATAILVDGLRFRDVSASQGDAAYFLETMNIVNPDRVEVMRGSGSSLYGTNAVGGIINVVTKEGGSPFNGEIQLEGGSMAMYRGRAAISGGAMKDRLKYSIGLSHLNTMEGVDGYSPWRNSGTQSSAHFDLTSRMSITGRIWATDDFLIYAKSPTSAGIPTANFPATGTIKAIPLPQDQVDRYAHKLTPNYGNATYIPQVWDPDNRRSSQFVATSALFHHIISSKLNWQASYQRVNTSRVYENGPGGAGSQPAAPNYGKYAGNIDTVGTRATWALNQNFSISGGYEFEHEFYICHQDNNLPNSKRVNVWTRARQNSHAGFFSAQASIGAWQASLSGRIQAFNVLTPRFDYSGTTNPYENVAFDAPRALTGDASLAYIIGRTGTKLRAHAGNSYRAPSLYERFGGGFSSNTLTTGPVIFMPYGDPRLAPDRYNSFDGGIDQYLLRERLRLSTTYFYTRIAQITNYTYGLSATDPFGRTNGYTSISGGISRGVELGIESRPISALTLNGSYAYVNADTDKDSTVKGYLQMFNVPVHTFGLVASHQWTQNLGLTLSLYHYSSTLNSYIRSGRAMEIPGYTKTDLGFNYRFWRKERQSVRVFVKMDNLLNRTYYVSGYRASGATAKGGITYSY